MWRLLLGCIAVLALPPALPAQNGDKAGEDQSLRVPRELIPPAPPLSPADALRTLRTAPGFRVELVAAEPLVEAPVALAFDADSRLWVVEMRGFMPGPDGKGEDQPVGRIAVLEDTDGDGRMDRRTTFLDGLLLPRALGLTHGGVLVAEPPKLWFCRDTNGDLQCDEKNLVAEDYGSQINPEHTANGLVGAMDNWIYSANHTARYRLENGKWLKDPTVFRGQWGLSQDDFGRLFYNSNSDQLRADLVPAHYLERNPNLAKPAGANVQLDADQSVWPIRVNPGINRGYQPQMLRDGRLSIFTAACGPTVFRGDAWPDEFRGSAIVCEPAGNLVRRAVVTEDDGSLTSRNACDHAEFLASTDERFRPVNAATGPDGALYLADMARGLIQHRIYLTTYLRQQTEERGLDQPINHGRIYRVVHESKRPGPAPRLAGLSSEELARELEHPNGWRRDTAQRLLVERGDRSVAPTLEKLAATSPSAPGRLHALWTLEGLDAVSPATVLAALRDSHPQARVAALRLSEPALKSGSAPELRAAALALSTDPARIVRRQLLLTLGELADDEARDAMIALLSRDAGNAFDRDAAVSGLQGRELAVLERLLASPAWTEVAPGRSELLQSLARCVLAAGDPASVTHTLELASAQEGATAWRQTALVEGMAAAAPVAPKGKPAPAVKRIALAHEPPLLAALRKDNAGAAQAAKLDLLLTWPGKAGVAEAADAAPLSAEQQKQFEAGKELYATICGSCHQPHGKGQDGLAPSLINTDWVTGSEERLVRIVLHGLRGPMEIQGQRWELEMPPLGVLEDQQIADVLTYVRREWGHTAAPVNPATVVRIRQQTASREAAWTEAELATLAAP